MSNPSDLPIIDASQCTGCGECIQVCPQQALVLVDDLVALVPTEDCSYCGECEAACPTNAITCPYEIVFEGQ